MDKAGKTMLEITILVSVVIVVGSMIQFIDWIQKKGF